MSFQSPVGFDYSPMPTAQNYLQAKCAPAVDHATHFDEASLNLQDTYGKGNALQWWVRWRVFYMACSELFRYNGGNEWGVTHLLFSKR